MDVIGIDEEVIHDFVRLSDTRIRALPAVFHDERSVLVKRRALAAPLFFCDADAFRQFQPAADRMRTISASLSARMSARHNSFF